MLGAETRYTCFCGVQFGAQSLEKLEEAWSNERTCRISSMPKELPVFADH